MQLISFAQTLAFGNHCFPLTRVANQLGPNCILNLAETLTKACQECQEQGSFFGFGMLWSSDFICIVLWILSIRCFGTFWDDASGRKWAHQECFQLRAALSYVRADLKSRHGPSAASRFAPPL